MSWGYKTQWGDEPKVEINAWKGTLLEELFRYETTFVFNNDFPALLEDVPEPEDTGDPLFKYVAFCFVMLLLDLSMNRRVNNEQIHYVDLDLQPLEEPAG